MLSIFNYSKFEKLTKIAFCFRHNEFIITSFFVTSLINFVSILSNFENQTLFWILTNGELKLIQHLTIQRRQKFLCWIFSQNSFFLKLHSKSQSSKNFGEIAIRKFVFLTFYRLSKHRILSNNKKIFASLKILIAIFFR